MAGHSGEFTPGGYLSTVIHTTLAGIEPTTFRLLARRATSRATETTKVKSILTKRHRGFDCMLDQQCMHTVAVVQESRKI